MKRFTTVLVCLVALNAFAEKGVFVREAIGVKSYPAAPRLAERLSMVPATSLPSAEATVPERLEEMRDWNAAGHVPAHIGFMRQLPDGIDLRLAGSVSAKSAAMNFGRGVLAATDHGTLVWSTVIRVDGAQRLRLHLEDVSLPDGAVLWVYGSTGTPMAFGRELIDSNHNLWTPGVDGDVNYLEIEVPAGTVAATPVSFRIREVAQIFGVGTAGVIPQDQPTCLIDATCVSSSTFPAIAQARKAIAHMEWPTGGNNVGLCSGGLLGNDVPSDLTPYFLTASHCFTDQNTATSVDFYFDYQTSSCNGTAPAPTAHVTGAQLLATSPTSDFTFLKMNSIPAGRFLLGWKTSAVANGTRLYRVSHPYPSAIQQVFPQTFSMTTVNGTVGECSFSAPIGSASRPRFMYSSEPEGSSVDGGIYGGSSGSPEMLSDGTVVGQLLGSCASGGANNEDGCDSRSVVTDGAFTNTFPFVQSWLSPGSAVQPTVCTANDTTLCLSSGRFSVTTTWQASDGSSGNGHAVALTSDTGYFWFFNSSNVEMVLKVLNACGLNQKYWVFAGGLTNVRVTMTVTDTKTGTVRTYNNPQGTAFQPIQDTGAFATCP